MKNSLIVLAAIASLSLTATGLLADDFAPPTWRYADRTTFQQWEFETSATTVDADLSYPTPPQGATSSAVITSTPGYVASADGRTGIWQLSGADYIELLIGNYSGGQEKQIRVQLTWKLEDEQETASPGFSASALLTVPPYFISDLTPEILYEEEQGDGWTYTLALLTLTPNPDNEIVTISRSGTGDIYIDEIVVDTICPEPATMVLLGLAFPFVIRRRARRGSRI
ncbi:MAG: hypothetical protein GY794_09860 [bacterium]|nr:hypothetical protein [bacterium]